MKKSERQALILQQVRDTAPQQLLSTRELAQQFAVSESTIRRDFQQLAHIGLLQRQYGGAQLSQQSSPAEQGQVGILLASRIDKYRDPFYNMVLEGVDRALERLGYQIAFVKTLHEIDTTAQAKRLLDSFSIKGLILLGTDDSKSIEYLRDNISPIISMTDKHDIEDDLVLFDGERGISLMVAHLAKLGYRRLAYIAGYADVRYSGFCNGLSNNNLVHDPRLHQILEPGPFRLDARPGRTRRENPDGAVAQTRRHRLRFRPAGDRRHGLAAARGLSHPPRHRRHRLRQYPRCRFHLPASHHRPRAQGVAGRVGCRTPGAPPRKPGRGLSKDQYPLSRLSSANPAERG